MWVWPFCVVGVTILDWARYEIVAGVWGTCSEEITPYVLMLVGIAIGSLFLILMWYRLVYLKRLREEMEMWRVAHPHEPFPRRRAWWRRCLCPKLCPCCWRLAYEDTHQAALFGGGSLSGKSLAIQHQLAAAHKQLAATGGRRT